ncbi:MAG: hypothetical protein ACI4T2_01885 [Christensenellales bacterium]
MTDLRSLFAGTVISTYKNGVVTDDTKEVMRTEHNNFVGSSSAYDPETLKKMSMFWDDDKLLIVPLFDSHIGGESYKDERLKMVLDFIYNCRIAKTFFGGDMFDNANTLGKTNSQLSRLNPDNQFCYGLDMQELNNCIQMDKVLFALAGNHDGSTNNRTKDANISLVKNFCLMNHIPYVQYNALLKVISRYGKYDVETNIFATHGSSKTMEPAVACESERGKMQNAMMAAGFDPSIVDLSYFGHLHIDGHIPTTIHTSIYDENGKNIADKTKTLHTICEPPMQGMNDFSARSNMRPTTTNAYATELCWVANPRYKTNKDTEFSHILHVARFPILEKDKNAYTMFAKHYLESELYREPHEIKKELEEKYLNNNQPVIKDYPTLIEGI